MRVMERSVYSARYCFVENLRRWFVCRFWFPSRYNAIILLVFTVIMPLMGIDLNSIRHWFIDGFVSLASPLWLTIWSTRCTSDGSTTSWIRMPHSLISSVWNITTADNIPPFNDICWDLVYLRSSPEVCYERLKQRGRKEESPVQLVCTWHGFACFPHIWTQSYLQTLHNRYEDWLFSKSVDPTFSVPILVRLSYVFFDWIWLLSVDPWCQRWLLG